MLKYAKRLPPGKQLKLVSDRVIRKQPACTSKECADAIEALAKYLIKNPHPLIVPVYSFTRTIDDTDPLYRHSYQYDMMRCGLLSKEEKVFVDYFGDLFDDYDFKVFEQKEINLNSKKEENPELYNFLKKVMAHGKYWDLHSGNVMKNEDEEYCLIDLEGFISYPLYKADNMWFLK